MNKDVFVPGPDMNIKPNYTIDPNYKGDQTFGCFVKKAKGVKSWSRILGNWNRRFITINLSNMKLAYSPAPLSRDKKYIDIEEITNVKRDVSVTKSGLCFQVFTEKRIFTFECENELQLNTMCKVFHAVINKNTGARLYSGNEFSNMGKTNDSYKRGTSFVNELPSNRKNKKRDS